MRAKEFIVEGVNQVDFNKNLLTILQQKYPGTEFSIQLDRVESADGELTVIANIAEQGSYVGCFMWDVDTGPYTGALGLAIKQTTDQLLQANPGKKPALFIGGDNENPEAWAHIADKLNYKLITDDDELEEGVAEGLNFDEIYGKYLKVTDNNGDPGKPGFSLVTPLNGDSWNWRERPEFKDLVKQKLNDPGFLGDHKYQQIIDAMSGKQFDPTKHIAKENFADGKVKGRSRPGRVKRAGASCNGSVTDLRQRAKNASGEKAKMYHWCANMKGGKK